MNKVVSVSVGVAAAVAIGGAAMANNTQTINSSQAYVDPAIAAGFVPAFLTDECTAFIGTQVGDCSDWGAIAAGNAAGTTIVLASGGTEANAGYFNNPQMMPVLDAGTWAGGIQHAGWDNASPFSSGLMSWDRTDGSSYFAGLDVSWTGYSDAANGRGEIPMGAPQMGGAESARDEWVDQTVVGYIESLDAASASNLDQNFRSQLSWIGQTLPGALSTYAHIDQRLRSQSIPTPVPPPILRELALADPGCPGR